MLFAFLVYAFYVMHIVEGLMECSLIFRRCLVTMIVMETHACMLVDWPRALVRVI